MAYATPPTWASDTPLSTTNLQILSDDITYLRSGAVIFNAASATTPNGVLTAFDIGNPAVACTSVAVYRNGLRKAPTTDYTHVSGENHVHFVSAPLTGDVVKFDYVPS